MAMLPVKVKGTFLKSHSLGKGYYSLPLEGAAILRYVDIAVCLTSMLFLSYSLYYLLMKNPYSQSWLYPVLHLLHVHTKQLNTTEKIYNWSHFNLMTIILPKSISSFFALRPLDSYCCLLSLFFNSQTLPSSSSSLSIGNPSLWLTEKNVERL